MGPQDLCTAVLSVWKALLSDLSVVGSFSIYSGLGSKFFSQASSDHFLPNHSVLSSEHSLSEIILIRLLYFLLSVCPLIRMYAPREQGFCVVHCHGLKIQVVAGCSRYWVNNCGRTERDVPLILCRLKWRPVPSYGLDSKHLLMCLFSDFFQGHQPCATGSRASVSSLAGGKKKARLLF